nr:unnamed protein product [Callosobruchus analis]
MIPRPNRDKSQLFAFQLFGGESATPSRHGRLRPDLTYNGRRHGSWLGSSACAREQKNNRETVSRIML